MSEPILMGVRSMCNLEEDDNAFDRQLLPLINSQIMLAHEFGVGVNSFVVTDMETWEDWLGESTDYLAAAKTWLGYNVLLMFDPPDNSTVLKSYQEQIEKMERMLRVKSEVEGHVKKFVPEHADVYEEEVIGHVDVLSNEAASDPEAEQEDDD